MRCAMTGRPVQGAGDAIWDDGEWISWAYINEQIDGPYPQGGLVEDLIVMGKTYYEDTLRQLPIYGALGEQYAARRFGIRLHEDPHLEGSDGRLGNLLVEIKTISPTRDSRRVRVKKSGNFNVLAIVKVDADFRIDAKLISRENLPIGKGKVYSVCWDDHPSEHQVIESQQQTSQKD